MRGMVCLLARLGVFMLVALGLGQTSLAEDVLKTAQYKPELAIVKVVRQKAFTEITIKFVGELRARVVEPETMTPSVCWWATPPNAPFLAAGNRRFMFLGGTNVETCPRGRVYHKGDEMILRFQPLDPDMHKFSFIEGDGGEKQIHEKPADFAIYINFLDIGIKE
jgi:hypothetical protein